MRRNLSPVLIANMSLRLDWCSHEAAKYAVEHWHYSKCLPIGKLVKIGVWEESEYIGCLIFSYGASPQIGKPYSLKQTEICELTRVALTNHNTKVSRIIAIALRMLREFCPKLHLVISFADPIHDHHGGIYQAGGWIYVGESTAKPLLVLANGKMQHNRLYQGRNGAKLPIGSHWTEPSSKYKYLMPLDEEMKQRILPLSKPYPKRASSETSSRSTSVES